LIERERGLREDRRMPTKSAGVGERLRQQARTRKIIHVDMDAFYASVEQRDNPALRGKPLAVGDGRARGVVAAASYEAREFGVRSAMPSITALRRCPDLIFVRPRFEAYKAVSRQIRAIFEEFTPIVEPLSLDEAYLDVTDFLQDHTAATQIAGEIRARIRAETELTASAGVSYNKFLAKLASDFSKPDGLYVITPKMGEGFVQALPIQRFHGVGPATAAKMKRYGIETGRDLRAQTLPFLQQRFGKAGPYFYWIARGVDERPVRADRLRKSIGAETTFAEDLLTLESAQAALLPLVERVWLSVKSAHARGRTVTVKIKFASFRQITRSVTINAPLGSKAMLEDYACALLSNGFATERGIRLLGVTLSSLCEREAATETQLRLGL
jgi:DNA polymerase IV